LSIPNQLTLEEGDDLEIIISLLDLELGIMGFKVFVRSRIFRNNLNGSLLTKRMKESISISDPLKGLVIVLNLGFTGASRIRYILNIDKYHLWRSGRSFKIGLCDFRIKLGRPLISFGNGSVGSIVRRDWIG